MLLDRRDPQCRVGPPGSPTSDEPTVPVWDRFVRLFHWSLASLVLLAFLTTDDARWLHEFAGYAVLALLAARIVWGVVGTRHALFISFLAAGPRAVLRYLALLRDGRGRRVTWATIRQAAR